MKVYDYDVDGSSWCREGVATEERPDVLLDTFWTGGDRHRLTAAEVTSARLRFDTDDFEQVEGQWDAQEKWMRFAPADREAISHQHRLQHEYFVRKGASPDVATQVENARQKVSEAEREVERAASHLQWARDALAALETQKGGEA